MIRHHVLIRRQPTPPTTHLTQASDVMSDLVPDLPSGCGTEARVSCSRVSYIDYGAPSLLYGFKVSRARDIALHGPCGVLI